MNHPFIVKLGFAFQNEKKLYFALEYCPGGELFNLLQRKRQFSEDVARFYVSQIILALEHLHKNDIVYRDLKPENVLIDREGYVRLTDFGLSKKGVSQTKGAKSVCGTPEYLAPEILNRTGHGKAVDWWTVGAILFEMLTGLPPFYTPNREELFEKIRFYTLKYPTYLSQNVRSLLDGLFKKDPEKRLGGGTNDADEIKSHPWFEGLDWDALYRKEIPAPFVPIIKEDTDVSNFDPEFTDAPIVSSLDNTDTMQMYSGWTFNNSENGSLALHGLHTRASPPKTETSEGKIVPE